jgi:hypothetical protein
MLVVYPLAESVLIHTNLMFSLPLCQKMNQNQNVFFTVFIVCLRDCQITISQFDSSIPQRILDRWLIFLIYDWVQICAFIYAYMYIKFAGSSTT